MHRPAYRGSACINDTLLVLPLVATGIAYRFEEDQVFTEVVETQIKAVNLIDGDWYVRLDGDLAGKVTGGVYDASQGDDLVPIPVSVSLSSWRTALWLEGYSAQLGPTMNTSSIVGAAGSKQACSVIPHCLRSPQGSGVRTLASGKAFACGCERKLAENHFLP